MTKWVILFFGFALAWCGTALGQPHPGWEYFEVVTQCQNGAGIILRPRRTYCASTTDPMRAAQERAKAIEILTQNATNCVDELVLCTDPIQVSEGEGCESISDGGGIRAPMGDFVTDAAACDERARIERANDAWYHTACWCDDTFTSAPVTVEFCGDAVATQATLESALVCNSLAERLTPTPVCRPDGTRVVQQGEGVVCPSGLVGDDNRLFPRVCELGECHYQ